MKNLYEYLIENGCDKEVSEYISDTYHSLGMDGVIDTFNFDAVEIVINWIHKKGNTRRMSKSVIKQIDRYFREDKYEESEESEDDLLLRNNEKRIKIALQKIEEMITEAYQNEDSKERNRILSELNKLKKQTKKLLGK